MGIFDRFRRKEITPEEIQRRLAQEREELERLKNPYIGESWIGKGVYKGGKAASKAGDVARQVSQPVGRAVRETAEDVAAGARQGAKDFYGFTAEPLVETMGKPVARSAVAAGRAAARTTATTSRATGERLAKEGKYLAYTPTGRAVAATGGVVAAGASAAGDKAIEGAAATGRFLRDTVTTEGSAGRQILTEARKPLFFDVRNTATPGGKLPPEVRSAINKARMKLQKEAAKIGPEYEKQMTKTEEEIAKELAKRKAAIKAREEKIRKIDDEMKGILTKLKEVTKPPTNPLSGGEEE